MKARIDTSCEPLDLPRVSGLNLSFVAQGSSLELAAGNTATASELVAMAFYASDRVNASTATELASTMNAFRCVVHPSFLCSFTVVLHIEIFT